MKVQYDFKDVDYLYIECVIGQHDEDVFLVHEVDRRWFLRYKQTAGRVVKFFYSGNSVDVYALFVGMGQRVPNELEGFNIVADWYRGKFSKVDLSDKS